MKVSIDNRGRVPIPRELRDRLHLKPGELLNLEVDDKSIKIRPERRGTRLIKQGWLLVADVAVPPHFDVVDWIREDRAARDRKLLGGLPPHKS